MRTGTRTRTRTHAHTQHIRHSTHTQHNTHIHATNERPAHGWGPCRHDDDPDGEEEEEDAEEEEEDEEDAASKDRWVQDQFLRVPLEEEVRMVGCPFITHLPQWG